MKISLNWVLSHIATTVKNVDVDQIVAGFNTRTAEIEQYDKVETDFKQLFIVSISSIEATAIKVYCKELLQDITMPTRKDVAVGQLFLIKKENNNFAWFCVQDCHSIKEGLFPAVDCKDNLIAGGWKKTVEATDYILDVDNKSINHRPDLWGHRGIAREIAAFMGWQMKPLKQMLAKVDQVNYEKESTSNEKHSLKISIQNDEICSRFAGIYCPQINYKPSQITMAMRLARVDSRPINTMVDLTNYVMFDISQPMHVFDGANFQDKTLFVRSGKAKEKLELLDDQKVNLTDQDIVVTDGNRPVALAGVMGGKGSGFSENAQSVILESASFNATMVRNSATKFKVQTEASARFAKQLDPMQNVLAIKRFLFLADEAGVITQIDQPIVSVGKTIDPKNVEVNHAFIESRLGIDISSEKVVEILKPLALKVTTNKLKDDVVYVVTVPTYRATKDISMKEDIVEEVGRMYGYENVSYQLPTRATQSFSIKETQVLRKIKEHCAFALRMREIRDYLFYDESFLKILQWYPENAVSMKNPVSENWQVLVTSLVPHLIKNVELNGRNHQQINLFEYDSVWTEVSKEESIEKKSLAGIFFGQGKVDFYDYKEKLEGLFAMLGMKVSWSKCDGAIEPWFDKTQTANIMLGDLKIGRAGLLSSSFIRPVVKGKGFVFEFDAEQLIEYKAAEKQFIPWSRYQDVTVDISMLVDASMVADDIASMIKAVDKKINTVSLIDFFEKDSWNNQRALTFRYSISDFEKTLTKEEIDTVSNQVISAAVKLGVEIR